MNHIVNRMITLSVITLGELLLNLTYCCLTEMTEQVQLDPQTLRHSLHIDSSPSSSVVKRRVSFKRSTGFSSTFFVEFSSNGNFCFGLFSSTELFGRFELSLVPSMSIHCLASSLFSFSEVIWK
jgi:hypothetical protein